MYTRSKLLELRQKHCEWKLSQGCPITEFEKCSKCKALHTKPLGLASLLVGGWEGIKAKQQGENFVGHFEKTQQDFNRFFVVEED